MLCKTSVVCKGCGLWLDPRSTFGYQISKVKGGEKRQYICVTSRLPLQLQHNFDNSLQSLDHLGACLTELDFCCIRHLNCTYRVIGSLPICLHWTPYRVAKPRQNLSLDSLSNQLPSLIFYTVRLITGIRSTYITRYGIFNC